MLMSRLDGEMAQIREKIMEQGDISKDPIVQIQSQQIVVQYHTETK